MENYLIMFTLLSFSIHHKEKKLYDCKFSDIDSSYERRLPFTSVVIGENGSGKSYLLSQISDFFRFIERVKNSDKKASYKYDYTIVEYLLNNNIFCIKKEKSSIVCFKKNEECTLSSVILPTKIIAMSFMVNDKFSFSKTSENSFYDYKGIRATSNASYTSTIKRVITTSLISSINDFEKLPIIKDVLNFLGMDAKISIIYSLNRKTLFINPPSLDVVIKKINSIIDRKQYVNEKELNYIKNNAERIASDIQKLIPFYNSKNKSIELTFNLNGVIELKHEIFQVLLYLERLEFISLADIKFYKKDHFSFEQTSSGEKNIIFTLLNLIACIQDNSLLLIDEPELSLHPMWQMKYINFIKTSIEKYRSCHLIFASHSHFMVSDLKPDSSSLISITQSENQRECNYIPYSTYAWSVENILYKVFHLRTTRNSQVEMDLYELSHLISQKSKNIDRVKLLVENLEMIILDSNDPLNLIIQQARSYIDR